MTRYRQWFFVILVLVAIAAFIVASPRIKLRRGLDIAGGMRVVYQVDPSAKSSYKPSMQSTILNILEKRVNKTGVAEPVVQRKGADQFIVEIPDVKNKDQIADQLRARTNLEFIYLKTVNSEGNPTGPIQMGSDGQSFIGPDGEDVPTKKVLEQGEVILTGADLEPNSVANIQGMKVTVDVQFKPSGRKKFADFTRRHVGDVLAMVLNGEILSAPKIKEPILNGRAEISGSFDIQSAQDLANNLNAGAMPVPLVIVEQNVVEATLGSQYVRQSMLAGIIGLGAVVAFMIVYYLLPGVMAVLALCMYTLFTFAIFKIMQVTMTLPGYAGFILSIGMAVDANILIFERTKEELRGGKTLHSAIDAGFSRAWTAILDSNVCTLITCLILVLLTSGPVVGFAKTLAIGVLVSMFTAITVTRTLLHMVSNAGFAQNARLYGLGMQWGQAKPGEKGFDIIGKTPLWFTISGIFIVVGLYFLATHGLKPGIDLTGGSMTQVSVNHAVTAEEMNAVLKNEGYKAQVQISKEQTGDYTAYVRTPELSISEQRELGSTIEQKISGSKVVRTDKVGSTISKETTNRAIMAVIVAGIAIMLYLSYRFAQGGFVEGLKYGVCALLALIHDVLVVLGASAIFGKTMGWEIDSSYVTAVLTMVGFSVHDTIVIFDRIRENQKHRLKGESFPEMVNRSILQSFARSVNTSFTVVLVLVALLIWGGSVIEHFNAVLLVGIITGTYSSIFNASPMLVLWERWAHGSPARPDRELKPLVQPAPSPSAPSSGVSGAEDAGEYGGGESDDGAGKTRSKTGSPKRRKRRF